MLIVTYMLIAPFTTLKLQVTSGMRDETKLKKAMTLNPQ